MQYMFAGQYTAFFLGKGSRVLQRKHHRQWRFE
uniref:Uncharacterized protein n=1 Tax=Anguilla anguilla TaxID=7936 RepID=A0A0E9PCJ4_ANGAN